MVTTYIEICVKIIKTQITFFVLNFLIDYSYSEFHQEIKNKKTEFVYFDLVELSIGRVASASFTI